MSDATSRSRVRDLFSRALDLDPPLRDAFLREACGGDSRLYAEVSSLLAAHAEAGSVAEGSPFAALDASAVSALVHGLRAGDRIGPYDVVGSVGAGGMGEVYEARDTLLGRRVAIKILSAELALDETARDRLVREAKALAALNHPNIGAIFGVEKAGGGDTSGRSAAALVLELVEGPTLAERVARGPLSIPEVLRVSAQIAGALEAAHDKGIIHRDLKPANIKVTPTGTVKVLDFGLAKAFDQDRSADGATAMVTGPGTVLGTPAYMSPEQVRGEDVDHRTDVWALGCVLFELLTGQRAFGGRTPSDCVAAVLEREPDWSALPHETPGSIRVLLRRCLQKDRTKRLRDIGDARFALEDATSNPESSERIQSGKPGGIGLALLGLAAAALVALAIPAVRHLRETPPPAPPETRLDIVTPDTDQPKNFALSPDGRRIVFIGPGVDGGSRLWLRSLAETSAQPLTGTEGATQPFWKPDSRALGFFADGKLKRLDLGGALQMLAPVSAGQGGGTWNADGVIVFAPSQTTGLMRVSDSGGAVTGVTAPGPQHRGHYTPSFLPDGRRILFFAIGRLDSDSGIYLGALDGRPPTRLTPARGRGVYFPSGWLLWVRPGSQTLLAQRLNTATASLTGEPVTVADGVGNEFDVGAVSVSTTGVVAYRTKSEQRQLIWVDRSGTPRGTIGEPDKTLSEPRLSPNGRRVAVHRTVDGDTDVWLLDGLRMNRFTADPASDQRAVWSPDGKRIVFRSSRTGQSDLYVKAADASMGEERLLSSDQLLAAMSWSHDGRFLLYRISDPQTGNDLWVLPMVGDRTPSVFLKTPFRETYGVFSPDGRWVAYQSDESGRPEIYVRPFVPPGAGGTAAGGQWPVSTEGGITPAWRPDGKEVYYLDPAGAMMAAPIVVSGNTLQPGAPVRLFPTRIFGGGVDLLQGRQYDVAPDGRFLINTDLSAAGPITLLMNWNPEARK
jgi:serine/threonine protein kinase/Tol biopolymer transport system component